jgi:hypothetical protein
MVGNRAMLGNQIKLNELVCEEYFFNTPQNIAISRYIQSRGAQIIRLLKGCRVGHENLSTRGWKLRDGSKVSRGTRGKIKSSTTEIHHEEQTRELI